MNPEDSHVLFPTGWNKSYPVAERAEGVYIYDSEGKRYLDGIGGMFVVTIGHGVKEIIEVMARQAEKLCFVNRGRFTNEPQEQLANKVITMAPEGMDRVFFPTSGSTANEIAMQIARYYHTTRGNSKKYKVIGQWHNYYGATVGAFSMSGYMPLRRNMEMDPYFLDFPHIQPPHCYHCPFDLTYPSCQLACAMELARTIEQEGPDTISAFIATPIIGGTGGAIVPPPGYFAKIREICDAYDILLIIDEVITGFGRLGKNFGIQHSNITPDIMTAAKTLGSGYASLGATMISKKIWETFTQSQRKRIPLWSTYAGHPLSCATALAVQNYITQHNLIDRCRERGIYLKQELEKLADREPLIGDVRGEGLFLGMELVSDRQTRKPYPRSLKLQEQIVQAAFDRGVIISGRMGTGMGIDGDHLSLCPPFIISESECDEIVEVLEASLKQVKQSLNLVSIES